MKNNERYPEQCSDKKEKKDKDRFFKPSHNKTQEPATIQEFIHEHMQNHSGLISLVFTKIETAKKTQELLFSKGILDKDDGRPRRIGIINTSDTISATDNPDEEIYIIKITQGEYDMLMCSGLEKKSHMAFS